MPDHHRLGDVNQGWTVALTTLMNERASIGGGGGGGGMGLASATRLIEMMRHFGVADHPVLRDELAKLYTGYQVAKFTNMRAAANLKAGGVPGPELSIGKLTLTANLTATAEFVAKVLGPRVQADTGEWGTWAWATFICGTPGMRIAGGSDETLRNIIGERGPRPPQGAGHRLQEPVQGHPEGLVGGPRSVPSPPPRRDRQGRPPPPASPGAPGRPSGSPAAAPARTRSGRAARW
ncbi:MAG: acyl-CoA dehydrogenase family protein [Acidimicrobiales bacterium]